MIVPPYPRLAGNNNNERTPKLMAAIVALHLSPKKANCSVIDMAVVESPILIYTLLDSSTSRRIHTKAEPSSLFLFVYELVNERVVLSGQNCPSSA
jgi:hypothetical protein